MCLKIPFRQGLTIDPVDSTIGHVRLHANLQVAHPKEVQPMTHLVPIPFIAVIVFLLIRAELRSDWRQIYFLKPLSTLLVILVAALSFRCRVSRWVTRPGCSSG